MKLTSISEYFGKEALSLTLNLGNSNVHNVGIDICQISRLQRNLERVPSLKKKIFTCIEQDLSVSSLAARFALKEACAKAIGVPAGWSWHDAQLPKLPSDFSLKTTKTVEISGILADAAKAQGVDRCLASVSHTGDLAVSVVISLRAGNVS